MSRDGMWYKSSYRPGAYYKAVGLDQLVVWHDSGTWWVRFDALFYPESVAQEITADSLREAQIVADTMFRMGLLKITIGGE